MTKLFAIAIPILPGKKDQWKKFADDLKGRYKKEFNESRKNLGVQERTFLQSTPNGDFVLVTLEGEKPEEAFTKFAEQSDEFTKWFSQQVKDIHGIDLAQKSVVPLPELVVETEPIAEHATV